MVSELDRVNGISIPPLWGASKGRVPVSGDSRSGDCSGINMSSGGSPSIKSNLRNGIVLYH